MGSADRATRWPGGLDRRAAATALVAVLLAVCAGGAIRQLAEDGSGETALVVAAPSASAQPTVEPTSDEAASPTAVPSRSSQPARPSASASASVPSPSPPEQSPVTVRESPEPTPTPTCGRFTDCPDGKPGWGGGYSSCHDATAAELGSGTATDEVFDGVTATYELRSDRVAAGSRVAGTVSITSSRSDRVAFTLEWGTSNDAVVYGPPGGAVHQSDVYLMRRVELAPGQTVTFELGVATTSCADTSEQAEPALPKGSYRAGRGFRFSDAGTAPAPSATPSASPTGTPGPAATPQPVPKGGSFALAVPFSVV